MSVRRLSLLVLACLAAVPTVAYAENQYEDDYTFDWEAAENGEEQPAPEAGEPAPAEEPAPEPEPEPEPEPAPRKPRGDQDSGGRDSRWHGGWGRTPLPVAEGLRLKKNGKVGYTDAVPKAVRRVIYAANRIAHTPYRYGGGHGTFSDSAYDCSGSVSYALHGAGLVSTTYVSGQLASWGAKGKGRWITIYANAGHVFMVVGGLRFDTSGRTGRQTRWQPMDRSTQGFAVRHPAGL
jgi:cell wall-associated NlpC family hydrolase